MKHVLLLLVVACAPSTSPTAARRLSVAAGGCIDPAELGAIPGDGLSDRIPIQAAIDAATAGPNGGTVCLGAGQWDLERAPIGTYNRSAALSTHGKGLTFRCVGPEAVLSITGDQGGESTVLFSIDPGAERIALENCTLRGRLMTATHEQTHAIVTSGICDGATCQPIRDIAIRNVTCDWPYDVPGLRKGDCIKLLGNLMPVLATETTPGSPGTEVHRVRIVGGNLSGARSAIVLQRGLHDVVIAGNTLHCDACDQVIDGEATGGGWDVGVAITGNTITAGPGAQGDFDIALTSMIGATVVGNTLSRGIALYRTVDTVVAGNAIRHVAKSNAATIGVANACDGTVISGNAVRRSGAPGQLVKLEPASGVPCSGFVVSGNVLTQETATSAVMVSSASRARVAGNLITHTVAATGYGSILVHSAMASSPITALSIADNVIHGPVTYGVTLEGGPGSFGLGVSVMDNIAVGTTSGLRCKNPTYFTSPLTVAGNAMGPIAYGGVAVNTGN